MKLTSEETRLVQECIEDAILYHKERMNFNRVQQLQQLYDRVLEGKKESAFLIPESISQKWKGLK